MSHLEHCASGSTTRRQLLAGTAAVALFDALRGGTLAQLVLPQAQAQASVPSSSRRWQNWSGLQQATPANWATPANEAELQQLLRNTQGEVRPAGSGHSFTALVPTQATLVPLGRLANLVRLRQAALAGSPPLYGRLCVTGAWRAGPPVVSILMRSATLTTDADIEGSRAATDVLIQPTPDGLDIRDWKGFDAGVSAGYLAAAETLAKLDGPVTGLRRRRSVSDVAPPETVSGTAARSRGPDVVETLQKAARRGRKENPRA